MASTTRRMPAPRSKPRANPPEDVIADKLSSLTISKTKPAPTPEQQRLAAMRAVNAASQELSTILQSGWKHASDAPKSPAFVKANVPATAVAKQLAFLRGMAPGDLDIERAAGSVIGKLLTLEMFDTALLALKEMHPRLCALLNVEPTAPKSADCVHLLGIPRPEPPQNPVLLTLASTFLLHALITLSHFTSAKNAPDSFTLALTSAPTLLAWAPLLCALPSAHTDSLLTRAYSSLIKVASTFQPNSKCTQHVFLLRDYALACLAHTSPGKIEARLFWDQSTKSASAYIKALGSPSEDATKVISEAFSRILVRVQAREDSASFMSGKGFISFCELWMSFANRIGDIATLDRIAVLIGTQPGTSRHSVDDADEPEPNAVASDELLLKCTRLSTLLAQTTALLDPKAASCGPEELGKRLRQTTLALKASGTASLLTPPTEDEEVARLSGKLQRAMERTRRSAVKLLESNAAEAYAADLEALLEAIVDILESALRTKPAADTTTGVLDTLFVLARTKLSVQEPRTHGASHSVLQRAAALVEIGAPGALSESANYARCVSGAFHNLAGTLYQAGRYGAAIPYLQDGCALGRRALELRAAPQPGDEDPKTADGWRQLEAQLWRRWELLGVCCSKIGDRQAAYDSFVACISSFPYSAHGFADNAQRAAGERVFQGSPAAGQLGTVVDRATYLGACELRLAPQRVSMRSRGLGDADVVGALLERQIRSLDGSRGKDAGRDTVQALLHDALRVYGAAETPVRRARTLVRCLEFGYHAAPAAFPAAEAGAEVERILAQKDLARDAPLAAFCAPLRAAAHLWLALHAHRRAGPGHVPAFARHVELACAVLEPLVGRAPTGGPPRSPQAPTKAPASKSAAAPARRPAARRPPPPRKTVPPRNPVTPRSQSRKGALPVAAAAAAPSAGGAPENSPAFDDLGKFLDLLHLVTRMLGLMAHDLLKVRLLDITRRLCEQNMEAATDGYLRASVELAVEYMKLGKTKRAHALFARSLDVVKSGKASADACVMFYLRHAESLAMTEDIVQSCELYSAALVSAERLDDESKNMSTLERVQCRVSRLEKAAVASYVFALIQHSREDIAASLEAMLQALRLWNRALDALTRLNPPAAKAAEEDNPFEVSADPTVTPTVDGGNHSEPPTPPNVFPRRSSMSGLEWRVSEGLLLILFALCEAYFTRGSAREAEYFAQQAFDLAESLSMPAMAGRALAKKGELQLHQRQLQDAHETLMQATELLQNIPGRDTADIQRLCGDYNQLNAQEKDAEQLYEEATKMLEGLDQTFGVLDGIALSSRRSSVLASSSVGEILHPELLATVLRQHIWLLRDNGTSHAKLLERFLALPVASRTKARENALKAKLTLHEVYGRFGADMFLSSLTESTIALPMGMSTDKVLALSPSMHDILHTLDHAEQLFWIEFTLYSRKGDVARVRDAVISLALIRALQTSLGKSGKQDPVLVAGLLDTSSAITLSREMVHKFPAFTMADDLQWPLASRNGSPISREKRALPSRFIRANDSFGSELDMSDDEADDDDKSLQDYWEFIRAKYQNQAPDISTLSASQMSGLPSNWTIVHISVTEDKSTLFVTRQHGGNVSDPPLVFCVPLKGRREDEADEHLTFEDALQEFNDIVKLSDEGTRGAIHVKDDPEARARWWKERSALDTRMRELLENIEFCWLGAFKTILSPRANLTAAAISDLRVQFNRVFHHSLRSQDKNFKVKPSGTHKRLPSESQIPSKVALDDVLLECFSTLSPKCRDEELEDLVFFILDLYQFHGVAVAIAEVDITQVVVDLRGVLEEHHARLAGRRRGAEPAVTKVEGDEHMFLILDKNIQGLPWESIPILRGKSVSRIPSVDFLLDRVKLAGWPGNEVVDRAAVDPRKGYCILNPSGDLTRTEGRFKGWVEDMKTVGWQSVVGRAPSEQQFLDALRRKDLVVYFGHGGAEQYLRSHKLRNLPRCAATMLWGCSSGILREMGDFDRVGTPYNYMLAGCPTLVANLWDVTDRDIDIFSQSVFDKLRLTADGVRSWNGSGGTSLVAAVAQSRASCKLKYLTGAAPVVYGIPFYL